MKGIMVKNERIAVTFVLQNMSWEYMKCFPGSWDSLGKGTRVGTHKVGSGNDEHSSLTDIKDSCRESWEISLGKEGRNQKAACSWSACQGNEKT